MAPFYGWVSTTSRPEPLQRGSLLFTTKFPEIPVTHFIKYIIPLPFDLLNPKNVERKGKNYKNLNILRTKKSFLNKKKTFFIFFEGLSFDEKIKI